MMFPVFPLLGKVIQGILGALWPAWNSDILASTTNKMLQEIARGRGMIVEERPIL